MGLFGSKSGRDGPDRRLEPRRFVNRRGIVAAPGLEMACVIVDLSDHGMRLRLDRGAALPADVFVIDVEAGAVHVAAPVWQKNQEAGLRWTERLSLRGLVPARLTAAREAWIRAGGG